MLVDLDRGSLIEATFRLPWVFSVPNLLYRREIRDYGGPAFVSPGLRIASESRAVGKRRAIRGHLNPPRRNRSSSTGPISVARGRTIFLADHVEGAGGVIIPREKTDCRARTLDRQGSQRLARRCLFVATTGAIVCSYRASRCSARSKSELNPERLYSRSTARSSLRWARIRLTGIACLW